MIIFPPDELRGRVVIEGVEPEVDAGRFPIKRVVGEDVTVEADIFSDGHDSLSAVLLYRRAGETEWRRTPMAPLVNDRWTGSFTVAHVGRHEYTLRGWVDPFKTWRRDLLKRVEAGVQTEIDLRIGAGLIDSALTVGGADPELAAARTLSDLMLDAGANMAERIEAALDPTLAIFVERHAEPSDPTDYGRVLEVVVDRERALFSSWYEFFPRSCVEGLPGPAHATLRDCLPRLEYVADMGFDVVYLPPIHPIGQSHRKGANNVTVARPEDPGSPWAIGATAGGHTAVEPRLGTAGDFRALVERARELGMEVALDLAYQCSPDHPWVKEHPEWFRRRPDGSVQYAENPPKKYEDIYPINFDTGDRRNLWEALAQVVYHWIEQGVRIFRVDNPHTKPFAFWEWLIDRVKADHPDVLFLAEAFTRPKVMKRLAKLGFTQSYTYFTWRNTAWELAEYLKELTCGEAAEYMRPNLWPNTPDILPEFLQSGGRPAFLIRLILAATLSSSYGVYGPPFELCEKAAREPGSEEYLDSEKYEVRRWPLDDPQSLRDAMRMVNRIRRENPALQSNRTLLFHEVDDDHLLCYSKRSPDGANTVIVVVNLDPYHAHHAWVTLDLEALGIDGETSYQMHDLLSGSRFLWHEARNYVMLDPNSIPAHILQVQRKLRTERDFNYYL